MRKIKERKSRLIHVDPYDIDMLSASELIDDRIKHTKLHDELSNGIGIDDTMVGKFISVELLRKLIEDEYCFLVETLNKEPYSKVECVLIKLRIAHQYERPFTLYIEDDMLNKIIEHSE